MPHEKWDTTKTKKLLRDERYCGVNLFGERRKEGGLPALITRDLFDTAQEILDGIEAVFSVDRPSACEDYVYYLHQRVYCPFCACDYTNAAAKGGAVRYYVCACENKKRKACPIKRINSNALHDAVLHEIRRAADHHTVMHRIIAESGGWGKADTSLRAERNDLSLKRQSLEMRIANYIKKIGDGKDSLAVSAALGKCEAELSEVQEALADADGQIATATVQCPTASDVQTIWRDFLELLEEATEAERKTLFSRFVRKVEITGKNKASLQIVGPIAGTLDGKFAPQANMGAVIVGW